MIEYTVERGNSGVLYVFALEVANDRYEKHLICLVWFGDGGEVTRIEPRAVWDKQGQLKYHYKNSTDV